MGSLPESWGRSPGVTSIVLSVSSSLHPEDPLASFSQISLSPPAPPLVIWGLLFLVFIS